MDEKQNGRGSQNYNFQTYFQRPRPKPNTRNYPNSDKFKWGYWNGTPLRERSVAYNFGRGWNNKYNNKHDYKVSNFNDKKLPLRSSSPVEGSEEYMTRKIQHTSAIIMRHLLSPAEELPLLSKPNEGSKTDTSNADQLECDAKDISTLKSPSSSQSNSRKTKLQAKEIYEKIMTHIGNLADGRKKNLINADNTTHWDQVITDMQKQQRLELSKILRSMNSNSISQNNPNDISSVLEPDIGIKIEDLPFDVIEELKHTLNLDLEQLNEELSHDGETTLKIKEETDEKTLSQDTITELENHSLHIKEEPDNNFSKSTEVVSANDLPCQDDASSTTTVNVDHLHFLQSLESTIEQTIERDKEREISKLEEIVEKNNLIDRCIEKLFGYNKYLNESILNVHNKTCMESDTFRISQQLHESTFVNISNQTLTGCNTPEPVAKKQKFGNYGKKKINSESEESLLKFSHIKDKVTTIELVNNELVAGTESGDILLLSIRDASILHRLDVSPHPVTCIQFVKLEDYTYMYVGCLENALRVFNFDERNLLKRYLISDQIRCMDVMWEFVFMGGKNGTLIRYGCKRKKIEFREQAGTEILVLKAAQEGPRCILIIGHRNDSIHVRDALSGLFLRKFSDDAIVSTVYSLVLYKNYIYCRTAKDNILVFSFHDGRFIKKIVGNNYKGVCCLSIATQPANKGFVGKNLLFIGCCNGSVYIYDLESNTVENTLQSTDPDDSSIACMKVLSKQVIIGKLTGGMESIKLPDTF